MTSRQSSTGISGDLDTELEDPCVRCNDVESAEFGDGGGEPGLEGSEITNVRCIGDDSASVLFDEPDCLGEVLFGGGGVEVGGSADLSADVDGDDVRAFFGQAFCVTAALAAGGAGNEGNLVC